MSTIASATCVVLFGVLDQNYIKKTDHYKFISAENKLFLHVGINFEWQKYKTSKFNLQI